MDIALLFDYSKDRTTGGPYGVAYDTVEGLKKNHRILEKEDLHINILSSMGGPHFGRRLKKMKNIVIFRLNILKK